LPRGGLALPHTDTVAVLTPVKDAAAHLDSYFKALYRLTYPRQLISLGFLESDSTDATYEILAARLTDLKRDFGGAGLWKKDFGFRLPADTPRWAASVQANRRATLARSRNHLLFRALGDAVWVLWLDVDVIDYPPDAIERLLETGEDIVQPNCVKRPGGKSFDRNAWRDNGRHHLHDLRKEGDLVPLHAVGGTMLLVRADLHRDGLVFPPYFYGREHPYARRRGIPRRRTCLFPNRPVVRGEIETEGFGLMAHDMGHRCWGMPNLEIIHKDA
jgi:glycosyltransferase involved in cell wall biosynthesis